MEIILRKGELMNVIMIGSHLKVTGGITRVVKNYMQAGLKENKFGIFPNLLWQQSSRKHHIFYMAIYKVIFPTKCIKS